MFTIVDEEDTLSTRKDILLVAKMSNLHVFWEMVNRGGSKPGGFPLFFGKGPDCVVDRFGTVPRRCC